MNTTSLLLTLLALSVTCHSSTLHAGTLDEARQAELKGNSHCWDLYFKAAQDPSLSLVTREQARDRGLQLLKTARVQGQIDDSDYDAIRRRELKARDTLLGIRGQDISVEDLEEIVLAEAEILKAIPLKDPSPLVNTLQSYELKFAGRDGHKERLVARLALKADTQNLFIKQRLYFSMCYLGGTATARSLESTPNLPEIMRGPDNELFYEHLSQETARILTTSCAAQLSESNIEYVIEAVSNFANSFDLEYETVINNLYKKHPDKIKDWIHLEFSTLENFCNWRSPFFYTLHHSEAIDSPWKVMAIMSFQDNLLKSLKGDFTFYHWNVDSLNTICHIYWEHVVTHLLKNNQEDISDDLNIYSNLGRLKLLMNRLKTKDELSQSVWFKEQLREALLKVTPEDMLVRAHRSDISFYKHITEQLDEHFGKSSVLYLTWWLKSPGEKHIDNLSMYNNLKKIESFDERDCRYIINNVDSSDKWIEACDDLVRTGKISSEDVEVWLPTLFNHPLKTVVRTSRALFKSRLLETNILNDEGRSTDLICLLDHDELASHQPTIRQLIRRLSEMPQENISSSAMVRLLTSVVLNDGIASDMPTDIITSFLNNHITDEVFQSLSRSIRYDFSNIIHHHGLYGYSKIPLNHQLNCAEKNRDRMSPEMTSSLFNHLVKNIPDEHQKNSDIIHSFSNANIFSKEQIMLLIENNELPQALRHAAINKLEKTVIPEVRERILKLLRNDDEPQQIRVALLYWIRSTGDFECTPAVAEFLDSRDTQLRQAAQKALEEIKRIKEEKAKWLDWYESNKNN